MQKLIAVLMFLTTGTAAHAVEYVLPSGEDVSLAQIQSLSNFATICDSDTATDFVCDLEPGNYQLVVFDALWEAQSSEITVMESPSVSGSTGGSTSSTTMTSGPTITLVTQECFGGPNTQMGCTAFCPSGAQASGGACDVTRGFEVTSVAGVNFYRCPTLLPPNQSDAGVTASVYCLNTQ